MVLRAPMEGCSAAGMVKGRRLEEGQILKRFPVMTTRGVQGLPGGAEFLMVGRPASLAVLECTPVGEDFLLVAQRDPLLEEPGTGDVFEVGLRGKVARVAPLPMPGMKAAFVVFLERGTLVDLQTDGPCWTAGFEALPDTPPDPEELERLQRLAESLTEPPEGASTGPPDAFCMQFDEVVPKTDVATRQHLLELDNAARVGWLLRRLAELTDD